MIANQGDILFADFGTNAPPGHEQAGPRPCVVVGVPSTLQATRFPMLMVAPMTTADLPGGPLYPKLVPGTGGLTREGTVLLDQVRALDIRRIRFKIGSLDDAGYRPIACTLRRLFAFD